MAMMMRVSAESATAVLFGFSGDCNDFMHLLHTVMNSPSLRNSLCARACLVVDVRIDVDVFFRRTYDCATVKCIRLTLTYWPIY